METFGQKVRYAIESQELPLDEVARATGFGIEHIEALQRDDFDALPGDDIVIEGLRSLARLIEVDPDEVIADYGRERRRWLAAMSVEAGRVREPKRIGGPARSEPTHKFREALEAAASRTSPGRMRRFAILASPIIALVVIALFFWSRSPRVPDSSRPPVARAGVAMTKPAVETRDVPANPAAMTLPPTQEHSPPAIALPPTEKHTPPPDMIGPGSTINPPPGAPALSIRKSGVGSGVVNHELVGEASQFAEGTRVWFWTLIEGGTGSESIQHVWIHQGVEVGRVLLDVGGASWRTKSYKDLNPGSKGNWIVEARDKAGHVLVRRQFSCSAQD